MSKLDYEGIGFKAGLEIHQQLAGKKLFCACPAEVREDDPHFEVVRTLRPSVGESGEVDVAAAEASRKMKRFRYQGYRDTTCLVELDDEPVSQPDQEAVRTAVMVADMLSMKRVDEVHPMRKVVVDGSNTSAFQRTMLCALDGALTIDGPVRVEVLCLEEDAAKIVSRGEDEDVYNLSRLGIPLLEITTAPDARSPEHLQAIASYIGMVLRSTGRVRRGLGTIRQDVNVSVARGARVEIKGVQDLELMPVIAHNEACRQLALADLADEGLSYDAQKAVAVTITSAVSSDKAWVQKALDDGEAVALRLPGLKGLLGRELLPDYRFGTEVAGLAKAWGFGGVIHDAEDPAKYGIKSWDGVREALKLGSEDGFCFVIGNAVRAQVFIGREAPERIARLLRGVPSEVRRANDDGTTSYLRPMPGAARMYPETDARPFTIKQVRVDLPELLSTRIPKLAERYAVNPDTLWQVSRAGLLDVFEQWAPSVHPPLVADVLGTKAKEIKRRHGLEVEIAGIASELLSRIADERVSRDAVDDILIEYAKEGGVAWERFEPLDEESVRSEVRAAIEADPDAPFGALMGAAMQRLSGKADGKLVSRLLKEELGR